jgi:acyl-homoserine-lactone acylase
MPPILFALLLSAPNPDSAAAMAARVEIARTDYGVPHIYADDLAAMGFGLGYAQSEDYGEVVARGLVRSRGEYARYMGHDSIDGDFTARVTHARAVETFHRLDRATRDVYRGFAEGVNQYIRLHPDEFPEWITPTFTAVDAHARDVQGWSRGDAARFVRAMLRRAGDDPGPRPEEPADDLGFVLDGSNAWALGAGRSKSGHAMLLRNPHLTWGAGYYEAQVRVPGVIGFYGDFRIGGAFGIIGGFNARLGWATTNNYPRYSQVYALAVHPELPDHALLDGVPLPLEERSLTVDYRTDDGGLASETRSTWWTAYGPVILRTADRIYILKDPRDGEFRRGEQFLRMMRAESLDEWLGVMRMRAHPSSNFTYADADGNIAHYYNARLPLLPHEVTGDTAAFASSSADIWSTLVPWDELPLYLNPPGGYVQQANDTPDYTNLNVHLDRDTVAANLPDPRLRLRSQLSLDLIGGDDRLSLEEMVRLKHSPRMLMAERLLDDLVSVALESKPTGTLAEAVDVLAAWDRTAAATSRGGTLFERWAERYFAPPDTANLWRVPWDRTRPAETPFGVGRVTKALTTLEEAATSMKAESIPLDIEWGTLHRVIRGRVDEPVSGCPPQFGCFRALSFEETEDGRLAANRGDAWILAVEFGAVPRAYSVLAYGESAREDSPHFDDQAALFARGELKRVAWTEDDVARETIRRYRPGEEVVR